MHNDDEDRARTRYFEPKSLEDISIDELEERIEMMTREIKAMREEIEKKKSAIGAADAFFKN